MGDPINQHVTGSAPPERGKVQGRDCIHEPQSARILDSGPPRPKDDPAPAEIPRAWFSRFYERVGTPRVTHELRHTWIEAARYDSPVKQEIWEIISGHSKKTGSDAYGGEKPPVLLKANEDICKCLLDGEMTEAVRRLVA